MIYLATMKLKIVLKKVDFLKVMNVQNVNVKMLIKMENLVVDKDIYVSVAVQLLMK